MVKTVANKDDQFVAVPSLGPITKLVIGLNSLLQFTCKNILFTIFPVHFFKQGK